MGGLTNKYKGRSGVEPTAEEIGALPLTGGTLTGSLNFSGNGLDITGDFSNATRANRLAFQTSTLNGNTRVPILPNGASRLAGIDCFDGTDADNASFLQVYSDGTDNHCGLNSTKVGTGARKDLVFQIDGITKAKINEADGKFNVDTLTASLLVGTDASKNLQSVTAATSSIGSDFSITLSGSTITFALPNASSTARGVLSTGTQTIAGNKTFSGGISSTRINPRVTSIASASTITPAADTSDQYIVTALAAAATIAIPSGTPVDGQKLIIRIKDTGAERVLTWTTSAGGYRAVGTTLPITTIISKAVYVGAVYNSQDGFWDVIAVAQL